MSEYVLYLVTAILIAISILSTRFVFAEADPAEIRAQAHFVQQDLRARGASNSQL